MAHVNSPFQLLEKTSIFLENFGVMHFTPTHLLRNHSPHCTYKSELAFTVKLQVPLGKTTFRQAILYDATANHHIDFLDSYLTLTLKSLLPFGELIPESLNCLTH